MAMFGSPLSFSKVNQVLPCFNIMCNSNNHVLISFLAIYLTLNCKITGIGKLISFPFKVMLTSFQYISNTSKIQFFLSFIFSGVNLPLILNKCILPAILHRFIGTYDCMFDIKSITLVMLENKHPLNKLDFLILLVTRYIMPNKIINNIPITYHCILHIQYMAWNLGSAASIPSIHCKVMFATKVFSFDCLHTT